jgi:5-(carboxyamino)imidazole ribonucleotide synthase
MSTQFPLAPGSALGMLGGGQLGRMAVHAAQAMGYSVVVLDPDASGPAAQAANGVVVGAYDDPAALAALGAQVQAVTTEFENVPAVSLERLAAKLGADAVTPAAQAVRIAQDRRLEKAFFTRCAQASAARGEPGLPPAPHAVLESAGDLARVSESLFPAILKTAQMGYDGKGQITVQAPADLEAAWHSLGRVACVLEKRLPLAAECSVIVARGRDGACVTLPIQRNEHRNGILHRSDVFEGNLTAFMPLAGVHRAFDAAKSIANELGYVGVLCIEFFLLDEAGAAQLGLPRWVVNEMAPRPHNSGHYSIEACTVSQFELQVRACAGLPLVQPELIRPAVMLNLLGDLWFQSGARIEPPWGALLALPGASLHLYGKAEPRKGRKMGHLTLTAASPEAVLSLAAQCERILGLE